MFDIGGVGDGAFGSVGIGMAFKVTEKQVSEVGVCIPLSNQAPFLRAEDGGGHRHSIASNPLIN